MMKRLAFLLTILAAGAASAANTALLPGSIDFNASGLWGQAVRYGLDDKGGTSGETRWYTGGDEEALSMILRYTERMAGYLQTETDSEVYRTIPALRSPEGPRAADGKEITSSGVFVDTKLTADCYQDMSIVRLDEQDKIACWLYAPESASVTNFMVSAGSLDAAGTLTMQHYVTDARVQPGAEFQLTVKAVTGAFPQNPAHVGFEVYANGERVTAEDGTDVFASRVKPDDPKGFGAKLYSMAITGASKVDKINFTSKDPQEDPEYDKDDVSMLREYATVTISGYDGASMLTNFPALVRISESTIRNFSYKRTATGGSDIRFTDENGKLVPCEVDTWDPTGESLVWVKVPFFRKGAKLTMHWSLKTGCSAPANDTQAVWSDYDAVWHLGDRDGRVSYRDSSAGGHRLVTSGGLESAGESVAGNAVYVRGSELLASFPEENPGTRTTLTFTGWYRAIDYKDTCQMIAGSKYGAQNHNQLKTLPGWNLHLHNSPIQLYQGTDGQENTGQIEASMVDNWTFLGFSVGVNGDAEKTGTRRYACSSERLTDQFWEVGDANRYVTTVTNMFQAAPPGFMADELRLTRQVRTFEWVRAEHDILTRRDYVPVSSVNVKGRDNYWVEEPSVTPSAASVEEAEQVKVFAGTPRYGTPIVQYFDAAGNLLEQKPTAAGTYRIVVFVNEGVREGLRKEMTLVIFEKRAYHKIDGHDRIMLFNSDLTPGSEVTHQGYSDVGTGTNLVWRHAADKWTGVGRFVKPGSHHVYCDPETGDDLWEFRHARLGNLFQSDTKLTAGMHFLPWGGNACRFDDSEKRAYVQRYAGVLILQNGFAGADAAMAISPLYEGGIGTIYFDAVNAYAQYVNTLKLQITYSEELPEEIEEDAWQDVETDVFAIRGGVYDAALSTNATREIRLAMAESGGTTDCLYRVRASLDISKPVRFRIVRTDDSYSEEYEGHDGPGLVEIDNIIASYPAMGVKIRQYGAPADPDDLKFRGQRAPFDIPFPSAADLGSLHGQVKVDYLVNNTNEVDASFVGAIMMNYRWRYLNQSVNDWQELVLAPAPGDPTRFVTSQALEGDGVGDIEYNFTAVVNAPFYEYVDYSGLPSWAWPDGKSERRGNVHISAVEDGVYSASNPSPAFGTDYFIRLRDGSSEYERFRLHVKPADDARGDQEKVIEMTLTGDHQWRGFYQTLAKVEGGVAYRLEAVNRQTEIGGDYQWTTNWYRGTDKTELPANDVVEELDGWAVVPCDGITGYLLFQLEDDTRALAVIHADYQNFNDWTDANREDGDEKGHFVGTSTDNSLKSGVSRTAQSYSETFDGLYLSSPTNRLWTEGFNVPAEESGEWAINVPFTGTRLTPFGWTADNGTWVCEAYRVLGGSSIALQMKGDGYGKLLFPQTFTGASNPRGIETFNYQARVAQAYDIHSFSYYSGGTNDAYQLNNYTFAVNCAMALTNADDFAGCGSLSLVANFRDSKGGYEARVERVAADRVRLGLYKWLADGTSKLLGYGKDLGASSYTKTGLDGAAHKTSFEILFSSFFISCSNTVNGVRVTAGVRSASKGVGNDSLVDGVSYYKVAYEDIDEDEANRFTAGTFGVASKDCPAIFLRPVLATNAVAWSTSSSTKVGQFYYWTAAQTVNVKGERAVLGTPDDFENWNVYTARLTPEVFVKGTGLTRQEYYGFRAQAPLQYVLVETSPHLKNNWSVAAVNEIDTFAMLTQTNALYAAEDIDIRLRTGSAVSGCDVVIDNVTARQWRGEDYDLNNSWRYGDWAYGAPTNFVFMSGWIGSAREIEISPMRAAEAMPCGIRSPLMDGLNGRGHGLGQISIAYANADRHARLLVQVATNGVSRAGLYDLTKMMTGWTTVETISFADCSDDELASGIRSCYLGIHGITGVMRVIVDPVLVAEAHDPAINVENDPTYGRVFITMAGAKDNPALDAGSWWGWNLRTTDDQYKWLLQDGTLNDTRVKGLSYALNNSVTDDVRADEVYTLHKPFLQTPIFTQGVIGEVTFRARRYEIGDASPTVAIYGTTSLDPQAEDADFEYLGEVLVDCDRYQTFRYQAPITRNYTAFRLAVTGVEGVTGDRGPQPASGDVRRVLIDEVAVFEAIKARLGFHNTGAFRSYLTNHKTIPNFPRKDEQPLCNEAWGVQTELYAAQLSDKIDLSTPERSPRVFFHWFVGTSPWGYENWKEDGRAGHGELLRTEGSTNLIYRASQLRTPAAVVGPETTPGTIVQYSLEVVYYMQGQSEPLTNTLTSADWTKPTWYEPIDCNAQYGTGDFAAYNILDTIAPGWAWFNEVNLFGEYEGDYFHNSDENYQYLEIAAPSEADMTDWSVRMLVPRTSSFSILTNTVAVFGSSILDGMKKDLLGQASGMVFRVISSLSTYTSGKVKRSDGTVDGYWTFDNPDGTVLKTSGLIAEDELFGIQLVRPSGIVEHEIVVMGTNFWGSQSRYADQYVPSNTVNFLNKYMKGAHFFHAGNDDGGLPASLSVYDSRGEASNFWDKAMIHTPGRINKYRDGTPQVLSPTHPTPLGTTIFIYANLGDSGHIRQTVGEGVDTTSDQVLIIQKGSLVGTDITYRVDKWYELGEVTTNGAPHLERTAVPGEERTWRVRVGVNASNDITVVANAQVCEELRKYGIDEKNRYTPAVVNWFEIGTDIYGNIWPDNSIYLAKYWPYRRPIDDATNMTLTQMYWLDMCPTISNQFLIAGFKDFNPEVIRTAADLGVGGERLYTNRQMIVYMAISNGIPHAAGGGDGATMYPPYVIRGVEVGSTSWGYATNAVENWTDASFKITGRLINGLTKPGVRENYVPLRWFVFDENSFYGAGAGDDAFTSKVEIYDPYSNLSPSHTEWSEWIERHGWTPPVWNRWDLDERMKPYGVEVMKKINYFKNP